MWLGSERLAEPHMTLGSIPSTKNKQKLKALVSGHSKYPGALQPLVTSMEYGCIVASFELIGRAGPNGTYLLSQSWEAEAGGSRVEASLRYMGR